MNSPAAAMLSGAAGALALNVMHEVSRKTMPHPPRVDIVGMRSVAKLARIVGTEPPENLRQAALAGDVISNSMYYSLVGAGGPNNAVVAGACIGLAAGIGVLLLPPPMGVGDAEVNRTPGTQVVAAGMYFAAGLIAGALYQKLVRD